MPLAADSRLKLHFHTANCRGNCLFAQSFFLKFDKNSPGNKEKIRVTKLKKNLIIQII
jgi:hypothetical protein